MTDFIVGLFVGAGLTLGLIIVLVYVEVGRNGPLTIRRWDKK